MNWLLISFLYSSAFFFISSWYFISIVSNTLSPNLWSSVSISLIKVSISKFKSQCTSFVVLLNTRWYKWSFKQLTHKSLSHSSQYKVNSLLCSLHWLPTITSFEIIKLESNRKGIIFRLLPPSSLTLHFGQQFEGKIWFEMHSSQKGVWHSSHILGLSSLFLHI